MNKFSQISYFVNLIDNEYIFIDLPYYSNIGDALIWKGTEDVLKKVPYKCLYRASYQTFQYMELSQDVIIIMMGGGNWGDLYAPHNELRRNIVRNYPKNKIIILPQTVYYESARNARYDARVFRKHEKLTICARDKYSYRFLKAFGFGKRIVLMPDMAFCLNVDELKKYCRPSQHKDLLFQRIDKEKTDVNVVEELISNYDVSDWPLYAGGDIDCAYLYRLINEGEYQKADEYAVKTYLPQRVKRGVEFISQYDRVFSNRLHGAILSILLDKEVFIVDNSYGKNSQYYKIWLKGNNKVHLLSTHKILDFSRILRFSVCWIQTLIDRLLCVLYMCKRR